MSGMITLPTRKSSTHKQQLFVDDPNLKKVDSVQAFENRQEMFKTYPFLNQKHWLAKPFEYAHHRKNLHLYVEAVSQLASRDNELHRFLAREIIRKRQGQRPAEEIYVFDSIYSFFELLRSRDILWSDNPYRNTIGLYEWLRHDLGTGSKSDLVPHLFRDVGTKWASNVNIRQVQGQINHVPTYSEALKMALSGWRDGVKRVRDFEIQIMRQFSRVIQKPHFEMGIVGDEVSVPEYLAGLPEHMVAFPIGDQRHNSPKICVDLTIRCDACGLRAHDAEPTPTEWTLLRGATVSLLIKLLVNAGLRPRLVGGSVAWNPKVDRYIPLLPWHGEFAKGRSGKNIYMGFGHIAEMMNRGYRDQNVTAEREPWLRTVIWELYQPGGTLDLSQLVFATAHDSFMRKLEFRFQELLLLQRQGHVYQETFGPHLPAGSMNNHSSQQTATGLSPLQQFLLPNFWYDGEEVDVLIPNSHFFTDVAELGLSDGINPDKEVAAARKALAMIGWKDEQIDKLGLAPAHYSARKHEIKKVKDMTNAFNNVERATVWLIEMLEQQGVIFT